MITDFVYVWINSGRNAERELRYSLRSLEKFFVGNYRVFIVGDCPTSLADLTYVEHHRQVVGFHPKALDAVRKMKAIINCPAIGDRFVYMYDDQVLLRPTTPTMLEFRHARMHFNTSTRNEERKNRKLEWQTFDALRAAGIDQVWNYETHLPRTFWKGMMAEVIDRYKAEENRFMLPTLYFNHWYKEQRPVMLHKLDSVAVYFTEAGREGSAGAPDSAEPDKATAWYLRQMLGKGVANWNDKGLTQPLVDALRRMFPEKSSHETSTTAYTADTRTP